MNLVIGFLLLVSAQSWAQDFKMEAKSLAEDLKMSLMKNLSEKIAKEGAVKAIPFCHDNVKSIAKEAAKSRISKYSFGRTSHKLRNQANVPRPWADAYLKEFKGTFKGDLKKEFIIHRGENSKRIYLEPLYIQPQCLVCHGEKIAKDVQVKLKEIYPLDNATGFKLGKFRGFLWVKEK